MSEYMFSEKTNRFIELNNFDKLSTIQKRVIEKATKNRDIVAISATGTGKTHAFLIPLMEKINPGADSIQALITVPTRELAIQLYEKMKLMVKADPSLRIKQIQGSRDIQDLSEKTSRFPHIIIGTPGKLRLAFENEGIRLDKIRTVIVDEADMTLEYDFLKDLDVILSRVRNCQIMCFSATFSQELRQMVKKYLENPEFIQIESNDHLDPQIEHVLVDAKHRDYNEVLLDVLKGFVPYVCVIFANTREQCAATANYLRDNGYKVLEMHGGLDSRKRNQAIRLLLSKQYTYIVASDVASRGIDIDGISHVVSLGMPYELEYYIHRAGRTGRAGKSGVCYTIYKDEDIPAINSLKERGIIFKSMVVRGGQLVASRVRSITRKSKDDQREIEIARKLKPKKEKVKPNYKKKRRQAVLKEKQKEKRAFIKQKIREQRVERYKANARKNND